jgi:hypothetical protein
MNKENLLELIDILSNPALGGVSYTTKKGDEDTTKVYLLSGCPCLIRELVEHGYNLNFGDFHGIGKAIEISLRLA